MSKIRRSRRPRGAHAAAVLAATVVGLCAAVASAATFTIDSVADAVDAAPGNGVCATAGGVCTIRAAIQEANALPGPDRIECMDKLLGPVVLGIPGTGEDLGATGDLDVTDDLDIDGDCERQDALVVEALIVDAAGLDRVLDVVSGTVTIRNVRLTGGVTGAGERGAGLRNDTDLTLAAGVWLEGNTAGGDGGGLYNTGTVDAVSLQILGNAAGGTGGGLANDGTVTLRSGSIEGNTAPAGGGIHNRATLTAESLPIVGNHATAGAGGGVLDDPGATAHLANLTIGRNDATSGADGLENLGTTDLRSATIVDHAGLGVRNDAAASLVVTNSVLADACAGTLTSQGWNVTASCVLAGDPTGNQIGVDPGLSGEVACQSVGWCPHWEPRPGSVLIDAGDPAGCLDHLGGGFGHDQRGVSRQIGAACDVGAVESSPACVGGLSVADAKLVLTGLGGPPGKQRIVFSGRVPLPSGYDLPLPNTRGGQIAVEDLGGGTRMFERSQLTGDPLLPGGIIPFSCQQWRGTRSVHRYTEIDEGCPLPVTGGRVRRVVIKDRSARSTSDAIVKFKVTGATVQAPVRPVRVSYTFGAQATYSSLGNCAEHVFGISACTLSGAKMLCR